MATLRFELSPDGKAAVTRLAHRTLSGTIHTWNTEVIVSLRADGSGYVTVTRNGATIEAEGTAPAVQTRKVHALGCSYPDGHEGGCEIHD